MAEHEFTLTEEQQRIIDINEGIHLVLAPPGSGKTELLALRVEKAIQRGYKDDEMICLTFTNRAAKGMRQRIEQKYPSNKIMIGNIHNFCSRFLAQNHLFPENYSILDEEDSDALISEIKSEYGYYDNVSNSELLKYATLLKQKSLGFPEETLLHPDLEKVENWGLAQSVCEEYTKRKTTYGFYDFDDLLIDTYIALTYIELNNKSVNLVSYVLKNMFDIFEGADTVLSHFKWLQVDEVQDLNPMQWAIIEKIRDTDAVSVYFGDYEQAIFSFLGAQLASIHKIEALCKSDAKNGIHNLQKNFRSPSYLLDIYTDYVKAHFKPVWKKEPVASKIESAEEGSLGLYEVNGTLEDEAQFIVDKLIPNLLGQKAIIVRYNQTADIISSYLKDKNIPHFRISGYDLFRRESVKGLMAFLSVLDNPFDKLSWVRLYYSSGATATLKESRHFIHEMLQLGITPFYLFTNNNLPPLADKQREHIIKENVKSINDKFIEKYGNLFSDVLSKMNSQITLNELIDLYFNYLLDNGLLDKTDYEEYEKPEINKLLNYIKHFTEQDKQLTLVERIKKYVPEYRQMKESDLFFGEDDILLTTVHKAKGLEFENVIVAEATDSTYPNWRQDNIEEDARALYVAMTRAKKRLYITFHNSFVSQYGKRYERRMSRFLYAVEGRFGKELPDADEMLANMISMAEDIIDSEPLLAETKRCFSSFQLLVLRLAKKLDIDNQLITIISEFYPFNEQLIEKYKDKWNWICLSKNELLSWSEELLDKYINEWEWGRDGVYIEFLGYHRFDSDGLSSNNAIPFSIKLIEKYKDKWNWYFLSENKSLQWTSELIEKFKEQWSWYILSRNQTLPWSDELIEKYVYKLEWAHLLDNLTSSIGFMDKYVETQRYISEWGSFYSLELIEKYKYKLDWQRLSSNDWLPWAFELIEKYKDRWDWNKLSWNRSLPWSIELIEKYKDKWSWNSLSWNKSLPWSIELIEKFKDKWNWYNLATNDIPRPVPLPWSITFIEHFKDKWNWDNLSHSNSMPWSIELIEKFKDKWNWKYLSENHLLPWSINLLEKYEDKWDSWYNLSTNKSLPWSIVLIERFKDKWNWKGLSSNNLSWSIELIEKYKDKWDWECLSRNESLPWSIDLLEKYENKWNWEQLGRNKSISKLFIFHLNDELVDEIMEEITKGDKVYDHMNSDPLFVEEAEDINSDNDFRYYPENEYEDWNYIDDAQRELDSWDEMYPGWREMD